MKNSPYNLVVVKFNQLKSALIITVFFSVLFSCQLDLTNSEDMLNNSSTDQSITTASVLYTELTIPTKLVTQYQKTGNSTQIMNWVRTKHIALNKDCKKAVDCLEKVSALNKLLYLRSQLQQLGINVETYNWSLCDGTVNTQSIYVQILPTDPMIDELEGFRIYGYVVGVGNVPCSWDIEWVSVNPAIATVDQTGKITGVSAGQTFIRAYFKDALSDGLQSFIFSETPVTVIKPSDLNGPILISPTPDETIGNSCTGPIAWNFSWSNMEGADLYRLYVIHPEAAMPAFDVRNITSTSFSTIAIPSIYNGWIWKVRARVNGQWTQWSQSTFNVEQCQ